MQASDNKAHGDGKDTGKNQKSGFFFKGGEVGLLFNCRTDMIG